MILGGAKIAGYSNKRVKKKLSVYYHLHAGYWFDLKKKRNTYNCFNKKSFILKANHKKN